MLFLCQNLHERWRDKSGNEPDRKNLSSAPEIDPNTEHNKIHCTSKAKQYLERAFHSKSRILAARSPLSALSLRAVTSTTLIVIVEDATRDGTTLEDAQLSCGTAADI
mmetsp:Transcript_106024/g.167430  ORF Transcript_106024/g.167430 Transcript_106024/m.167430 type:complete len:108 (-) Transcript_106024:49-372(-)